MHVIYHMTKKNLEIRVDEDDEGEIEKNKYSKKDP